MNIYFCNIILKWEYAQSKKGLIRKMKIIL